MRAAVGQQPRGSTATSNKESDVTAHESTMLLPWNRDIKVCGVRMRSALMDESSANNTTPQTENWQDEGSIPTVNSNVNNCKWK